MRPVKLRTRTIGCHFATVGQVVARNGRVVGETRLLPYGFTGVALRLAEAIAKDKGWGLRCPGRSDR